MPPTRPLREPASRALSQILGAVVVGLVLLTRGSGPPTLEAQGPPCDVVCENAKTGNPSTEWDIVGAGDPNIQGFATDISVNRGQTVHFKISSATPYDISIYRLGYYGGAGARKVGEILGLPAAASQPACATDSPTGLVDCGTWLEKAAWTTPTDVPSGIFIAKLQRQGGGASHIPFVVRDDTTTADLLFQTSDTTWQAYNQYGGPSLYCGGPIANPPTYCSGGRAAKVSYNRPITTRGSDPQSFLFNAEYPMVRWLEANGYKVKYWAGVDTDRRGIDLVGAHKPKIFLSVGHDEYWSNEQRTRVENARGAGVHLAFFSGNEVFWKTRWENSIDGSSTSHRTLVSYKETLAGAEIDGLPVWTGTWRDNRFSPPADGGRPENALTGTIWTVNSGTAAIKVPEPFGKLRLWRGIAGVADLPLGDTATLGVDTLGYEWDEDLDNGSRPTGLMRLSSTLVHDVQKVVDNYGAALGIGNASHALTLYRHSSGALVFGAGTVQWSWGLDSTHDRGTPATHPADVKMQQATVNLFADMGNVQPILPPGSPLVPASPSSDIGPPVSAITSPSSGSLHAMSSPVFIKGTANDTAGQVAGVEVSTDGGITWNRATGTTVWSYRWIPTSAGSHTIKSRAVDDTGNLETLLPSIFVDVTSPNQAPGGPVLVVTSPSNPFSTYYTEILRAEGLNVFSIASIGDVTAPMLANVDVVILGSMALSAGQVTIFTDWVTGGGNLIAMRPDKQLYGLLGLSDAAATLSNAYLLVHTGSAPGTGIVGDTMQFHGTADLATLNGAAAVATFYSDAATPTTNPAVTIRPVGGNGGQVVAFLYDLARSIVLTRQGNPAWAGQNRDLFDPVRSNDMFFGPAIPDPQPNWIDFSKILIPQADEQQRLLANSILYVNQDRRPLPRFWYFPHGKKAAVIMTGDDHGFGIIKQRFDAFAASSPANCSVDDWECIRSTGYIYANTPTLFDSEVASYVAQGFEIALHPNTGCLNYTPTSLDQTFSSQLDDLALAYPSAPSPRTNRTHCVVWSDWSTKPETELRYGIRLDTNYYYWPASWVLDRPGFMTGSGMPMRFAKETGEIIDVYQAATHETDESAQSFPMTMNTLLDNALGPQGYYGAFTANVHGDGGTQNSEQLGASIVNSAKTRNVPVVSAVQMLNWLDGRNNSSFGSITWDGGTLGFTLTQAAGANGLRGMLPYGAGGPLQQITKLGDPNPVAFTVETIKGIPYAFFSASSGTYQASYLPDTTPPVISGVGATPLDANTAVVTWTTDETSNSRVDYGTSAASLNQNESNGTYVLAHGVTLNGLSPNTTYYYRVRSVDFFGNPATFPVLANPPLTFTTPPVLQSFLDTTVADFSAGVPDAGAFVAQTDDGEVMLKPADGAEFYGTTVPAGWSSGVWDPSGSVTVIDGKLRMNNGWARRDVMYTPGRSLEFVANFGPDAFQHSGLAQNFNCSEPWAIFSTSATTGQLFARTTAAGCGPADVNTAIPGTWLGTPHRFRIDWNANDVAYFIDGAEVARHNLALTGTMQMLAASDFDDPPSNPFLLELDWERLSPYAASGVFLSRVFDAGAVVNWYNLVWSASLPSGTGVAMAVRTGNTPTPDASWTAFTTIGSSGGLINSTGRYVQYRATLSTSSPGVSPELRSVTVGHAIGSPNTPPVAVDDAATTPEDTPKIFPASGAGSLTANDTDAETPSDQLTIIAVSAAAHGTAVLNPNGTVTYTPSLNYNGPDTFDYTVSDGSSSDIGTVTMTVSAVNDPPTFTKGANQSVQKNSGARTVVGWATSMSVGPANEAGQTLTGFTVNHDNAALFSVQPAVAVNGTLTYTPAPGAWGVANVTVRLSDNGGTANGGADTSAPQNFTITVVDPPPVAQCQNVTVTATFIGTAAASINNGSFDPDGGAVTLAQVPPGPYMPGQTTVTLNVTDLASQVASCNATVTVNPFAAGASFGFEEASGNSVLDSSGNSNNGTFNAVNGPQRTTAGRFGKAMQFDGVNDLITIADSNSLDLTSAMTLMAWVNVNTQTGWRNILMKQNGSDLAYAAYANNSTGSQGRPDGFAQTGGVMRDVIGNEGALSGQWMHIAVTLGGGSLRMYVNGTLDRTVSATGNLPVTTGPLTLGGNNVWLDEFFSGVMDEVRVLGVALSIGDIRTLMRTPVVPGSAAPPTASTGLVASYNFNDGTATDKTGLGHNGVVTGAVSAPGIYGQALSFNGTSNIVQIADANDLDLTTGMTLEAWVKPATTTSAWKTVMLKQGPNGLVYALYSSDQAQHSAGMARIAGNDRDARAPDPLAANVWSHLAVTYDKAQGMLQLWVDGIPRDTRAITGDITTSSGALFIGGNQFWGEYFNGQIDNVRVYNRALGIVEIQTNQVTPVP